MCMRTLACIYMYIFLVLLQPIKIVYIYIYINPLKKCTIAQNSSTGDNWASKPWSWSSVFVDQYYRFEIYEKIPKTLDNRRIILVKKLTFLSCKGVSGLMWTSVPLLRSVQSAGARACAGSRSLGPIGAHWAQSAHWARMGSNYFYWLGYLTSGQSMLIMWGCIELAR